MKGTRRTGSGSAWDYPASSERGSGVGRVVARVGDHGELGLENGRPLRLLLVEDSDDDATLVMWELKRGGYVLDVQRVTSQIEFKSALASSDWDAIVSDHTVPGYGGLFALADLRESGLDIPFILVSGSIGESVAVEAMKAGAQDYVLKRDLTRLPVAIARELRERETRADQERMREQLMISERMASAGTLAAGVAHEINNPLAVAVANVEFITEAIAGLELHGIPRLEEALRDTTEGLQRIRDIVRDVKLFSRPNDKPPGPLDVRKVVDSSTRMAWNEIRHRARLVKDFGETPLVHANESRVGQVVLNLVVNAAQAIREGHADANEIRIVTRTDAAGWAVIEVRDTGSGIPPENLERIFDPFYTTKAVGVGTGLGLAICHKIVAELGGRIDVQSQVGKGTVFFIAFPPAASTVGPVRRPSKAPRPSRRASVLVVDDEVAIGMGVQRILARYHDVEFVTRGQDALARIVAGERFDAILSDVMMPEMTGVELHQSLARQVPEQAERVVFLTGGAFTPACQAYLDEVSNRTVDKPFRAADVLGVIEDIESRTKKE